MSSEKQIDDYINELEEKNEVYVNKELEYADKCHKLEEQLGCPLDVIVRALKDGIYFYHNYYKDQILKYIPVLQYDHFICGSKPYIRMLKDYKKTWWLKEDKSE